MENEIREIARQEAEKLFSEKLSELKHNQNHITLDQAKEEYDLFGATLYRSVNRGDLHLYKRGGKSFLKRSEVEGLFIRVK